jgi:hypothetical protein
VRTVDEEVDRIVFLDGEVNEADAFDKERSCSVADASLGE